VSASTRWSLGALVVLVALAVALIPMMGRSAPGPTPSAPLTATQAPPQLAAPGQEASEDDRAAAGLEPCPTPTGEAPAGAALAGVELPCLADGSPVDLGAALAGKPALLNLWAYWCGPCAQEMPHVQQFARENAGEITVLTVHNDPKESAALAWLRDFGITLPGVEDGQARVRAAVGAPAVLPVSVVLRADGTVAAVLPVPFESTQQIEQAVQEALERQ
jgi:thiol-disulfide isomerase/thioredoxin